jgi:acetyl-CoA synthetase
MLFSDQNIKNHYLKEAIHLDWIKFPKIAFKKNNNNHYDWFPDGKINLYENCIAKNLSKNKNKIAIIAVNQNKKFKKYTYYEIDKLVNNAAFFIKQKAKNRKIRIMIHASASIESAILMLASAKLGIHFSVIFEELEKLGIKNRVQLFKPNIFFSRLSKKIFQKKINFKNLKKIKFFYEEDLKKIFYTNKNKSETFNKIVSSNHNLFTLFTSGSTGTPKGITHSTGGYMLQTKLTCKYQFGMNENSIVLTASDAGWINGHTYSLFGPLLFGATTILIERPISLIDTNLFKKILKLKTNIVYLPVTLIRLIKSLNRDFKINKKYIKTLGSMGEPLAPSVANWFAKEFLKKNRTIVNTYFQTETGGIICSPRYNQNVNEAPHGSVGKPISKYLRLNKLDFKKVKEVKIITPWPGMMKNVINGKLEWNKYWDKDGNFKLFDLATKRKQNIYIHGRKDDVINIRGHRIGSEEIESTLLKIKKISECCVITLDDKIEGSKIYLFVVSKFNLDNQIENLIISNFGTFAIPKKIFYVEQIPKTRSGKILRRLLRNVVLNPDLNNYGDTTTILNINSLKKIQKMLNQNG